MNSVRLLLGRLPLYPGAASTVPSGRADGAAGVQEDGGRPDRRRDLAWCRRQHERNPYGQRRRKVCPLRPRRFDGA